MLLFFLPQREVFLKKFDNGLGISEGLLVDVVDLFEGIRKSSLTEGTGLLVVVHDLVVEHREVEGKAKSDWVAGIEACGGSLSLFVVLKSTFSDSCNLALVSAFGNVSVVITDHLVEEGFGLINSSVLQAKFLNDIYDGHALVVELSLDLLLVSNKSISELGVLWVLLNGTDGSDSGSL